MSLKSQVSRIAIWKGCRVELMKAWLNAEVPRNKNWGSRCSCLYRSVFCGRIWLVQSKAYEERHKRGDAEMIIFPYFFFTQLWSVEEDDLWGNHDPILHFIFHASYLQIPPELRFLCIVQNILDTVSQTRNSDAEYFCEVSMTDANAALAGVSH